MNYLDALKTGRWFGRGGTYPYQRCEKTGRLITPDGYADQISIEDLLRDDWEVRPVTVSITTEQFWDAFAAAVKEDDQARVYRNGSFWPLDPAYSSVRRVGAVVNDMANRLGLGAAKK